MWIRDRYNYYSIANDSCKIGRFANVMKYSMYKTVACKYKTNVQMCIRDRSAGAKGAVPDRKIQKSVKYSKDFI